MGAPRQWFTPVTCEGLSKADCRVLNCAVRNLHPSPASKPTHEELCKLRMAYRPGMSARHLLTYFDGQANERIDDVRIFSSD